MRCRFVILLSVLVSLSSCSQRQESTIPLVVITDFGEDVDDAEALAWIASSELLECVGIIHIGYPDESYNERLRYFMTLTGLDAPLIDSNEQIDSLLTLYQSRLRVVVLAHATPIADYLEVNPDNAAKIHSIYVQAYPSIDNSGNLSADDASYNFRVDMDASNRLMSWSKSIPFVFVGKYAAYELRLTKNDFEQIAFNSESGRFLYEEAITGIERFAGRDSATFYRIFDIDPSLTIEDAKNQHIYYSNPYDLLTVIAIEHPEYFSFEKTGIHQLTGHTPQKQHIPDPEKLRQKIIHTLNQSSPQ